MNPKHYKIYDEGSTARGPTVASIRLRIAGEINFCSPSGLHFYPQKGGSEMVKGIEEMNLKNSPNVAKNTKGYTPFQRKFPSRSFP